MTDDRLRQQQRQNELRAFLDYEQRLRDAYARSEAQNLGRRVYSDPDWGWSRSLRRRRQLTPLSAAQSKSTAAILGQSPGS
jgi:hypothetical protein